MASTGPVSEGERRRPEPAESKGTTSKPGAGGPASDRSPANRTDLILRLQRTVGNAAVCKLLGETKEPAPRPRGGDLTIRRMLMTHNSTSDDGTQVDQTGTVGLIHDYSRWLAQDTSALVVGEPRGVPGLIKTLKKAEVDGATLRDEVVKSIMGSGSWKELNTTDKRALIDYIREADQIDMAPENNTEAKLNEFIEDWSLAESDALKEWLASKLGLDEVETVGGVVGTNPPLAFHADLAYLLYEATKEPYYGEDVAAAYVAIFKQMIGDVNAGEITEFSFVRKYGAASHNWGAEFTVEQPTAMKEKYEDKAVLHTHYPDGTSPPNYAHTKPEEKKFEPGFGYTEVELDEVANVDDTQKAFNTL